MKKDKFGQIIVNSNDLCDLVMQGLRFSDFNHITVDKSVDAAMFGACEYKEFTGTIEQFDSYCQQSWYMPSSYQQLDVYTYILSLCKTTNETARAKFELAEFQKRNLLNLLKYLKYLVDTMQENNIIWGVGRGSSVSSFVLYLLKVHQINPLEYELDFADFMR